MCQSWLGLSSVIRDFFFLLPYIISGNLDKDKKISNFGHITLSVYHQITVRRKKSSLMVSIGFHATAYDYTSEDYVVQNFSLSDFFFNFIFSNFLSYVSSACGRVLGIMTPLSGKQTSVNKKYRYYLNIRKSFTIALQQLLLRGTLPIVKHLILISSLKGVLFVVYVLIKWEDQMIF